MAISLITEVLLLDGFPTTALLDTGSSVDLIRPDVVQSRGMPTKKELRVLRGFNGSLEDVSRSVEANVMMNGYDVKITALIVPNLPYEMIIGLSTLQKLGYELTRKHRNELQTSLPPVSSSMAKEDPDPSLPSSLPPAKITPIEFELSPASPQVKSKPYRLSRDKHIWAQDKINEMLTRGIIRPSESKYASPCVIVPKADGSFRLCQDYRAINKFTDLDPFPFPCIDDVISNLGGCKVFSKIDLKDGFHQMPLSEKSKRFTAFVLPFGHYEFNRLPFGWKNSPSKFQRIMVTVLGDLLDDPCIWVYIDDIVVGGRTLEDCELKTRTVVERLKRFNLTINEKKSVFHQTQVKFLGRTIDGNTKTTNQESVEKVKQMRRPSDLHSLRVFTGLTGHFRAFIKDYAKIVRPLDQLKSKGQEFIWSDEAEAAFQALKTAISSNPVLQLPDWKLEFELCTDASNYGCGAILYQRDPSKSKGQQLRVIGYYSHTFTKAECNFSVTDKEGLAVINAIKYFRTYLEGRRFTVHTDHQALSYILGIKEPKGRLGRWQVMLMGFDVLINHRSG
ncbi:unnamed protein product [Nesidiocoris tenuis]|uniref:RNA-directed DNA polymerase n=1 Tax=Nesidiocoris tenuis TaxID=355587 RepID=A0A6H5GP81_9HEMI|nr:unnamed protein product [Nesidiocoris tenuis]